MFLNRFRKRVSGLLHSLFQSFRRRDTDEFASRFASDLSLDFGMERLESRLLLAVEIVEGVDLNHTGDLIWNEDVIITGNGIAYISGDLTVDSNALIQGDNVGADDSLTIFAGGTVTIRGDAMGGGLADLRIFADDSIGGQQRFRCDPG